ncbi:MAG: hypothetical protein PHD48_00715 [Alphaproteobacteria bacterium]|nr:hypothetical protein [Alphaproteobacteria bacterium]
MTQLSYQPAFDPFHATYRLLRLRESVLRFVSLPKDHLRILDYYLLLPFRIDSIRLQQQHRKYRKLSDSYAYARPYGEIPEDRILFNRMSSIQTAALETLAKTGLISREKYDIGIVAATLKDLPNDLALRVAEDNTNQFDLMDFLQILGTQYELLGANGLKGRSGLMEFFYDAA